jgi:hypothetical protein
MLKSSINVKFINFDNYKYLYFFENIKVAKNTQK